MEAVVADLSGAANQATGIVKQEISTAILG